jgi:site-specific DNA-methyltransferase (adenine-specific)
MPPVYNHGGIQLWTGDCRDVLREIADGTVQMCVTSPPFWGLRDYGVDGQIGLERNRQAYIAALVGVFREVRRVLAPSGTVWLELGDSYGEGKPSGVARPNNLHGNMAHTAPVVPRDQGVKAKDLQGIPWRVAFALQEAGWYLRSCIIWEKPDAQPESVKDRPTTAHSYVFLLAKSRWYAYHQDALREAYKSDWLARSQGKGRDDRIPRSTGLQAGSPLGANARTIWRIVPAKIAQEHYAVFPEELAQRCVLAGSRVGETVLDPFSGSGTSVYVAKRLERKAIGIELNAAYQEIAIARLRQEVLPLLQTIPMDLDGLDGRGADP